MTLTLCACFFLQSVTPEVIEHAQAGAVAAQQGHLAVAIDEYRKVTALQPNSAVAHARLGEAYFQSGDYGSAIPELEYALKLNPAMVETHQTLGVLLLVRGNAEAALPHLEKEHSPELLGLADLETGRLGSAISELHAALDQKPDDLNLLYYFGRATQLASKRSSDQLAKLASGGHKETGREVPRDLLALENALAKQPNDPDLLAAFSRTAAQASAQTFDRILQLDANSARAHQVSAERAVDGGRVFDAEKEYDTALRLKPNAPNVHLALGDVFASEGKWPAAIGQFQQEVQLRPLSADARYSLGSALLTERNARVALEELTEADRLQPDTPQILLELGKAALAMHDTGRAETAWKRLLGIDDHTDLAAAAHLGLATLYQQAGKTRDAERERSAYEKLKSEEGAK